MNGKIFSSDFKTTPFWWEAASPETVQDDGWEEQVDVAIVGSGYSGLSCALELARANVRVAVLEQHELGWGASSRNGGMLSQEPKFASERDALAKRFGSERAERLIEDGRSTFDNLKEIVERESIECHLQQNGRFVGAHAPPAFKKLEAKARVLQKLGREDFKIIPRERQHEVTESRYYYGGLLEESGGCLHPALYHKGLLQACRRQNTRMFGKCKVTSIVRDGEAFKLIIDKRRAHGVEERVLRAREVMLGTNGYTGDVTPWHQRRLIPMGSYIIATEELPENRIESMFRNLCTMSNTQRVLYYYRPSPDGRRVIFGGRASFSQTDEIASSKVLYEYMCDIFPTIRGVKITHGWNGNVAFTFDQLPHMGVHDGMHFCMGCNGSGVQMMSYLGRQIALKILNRTNRPCGFDGLPFNSRPLYRGKPWFLPVVGNWYRFQDKLERLLA